MSNPVLTIGMIVKNEIRCLERCLKALQPLRDALPCELIIADTGSDDGTREIAEKYADVCFDFPWVNDFSAARNAVMDRAGGQWYLSVDADEYLDERFEPLVQFLQGPDSAAYSFAFVTVRNYMSPDMRGTYSDFQAGRMLRMDTGLRFKGTIHESWKVPEGVPWTSLHKVVFHHDGYAFATEEEARKKSRRNLPLLLPLLEEEPENFQRWMQVMESARALPEEGMKYARKGFEFIQARTDLSEWSLYAPALGRAALQAAWAAGADEFEPWMQWCLEQFPNSPYLQVDSRFYQTSYLYNNKRYSEVIEPAQHYLRAVKRHRSGGYARTLSILSGLHQVSEETENSVLLMLGESYRNLEQYKEAYQSLSTVIFDEQTHPKNAVFWLTTLQKMADKWDCTDLVRSQLPVLLDSGDGTERSKARGQACLSTMIASFLPGQDHEGWRLYTGLENELGASARCMKAEAAWEAEAALSQVEQWAMVPVPVMARAVVLGAALPESFYTKQNAETLREIASNLSQYETEWMDALLTWPEQTSIFKALQFSFEVQAAALRDERFSTAPQRRDLLRKFISTSQTYLSRLYHPDLLEREEDSAALPGLHRFARQMILAFRTAEAGSQREGVQRLHAALDEAPAMKQAVEVALDMIQETRKIAEAAPELLALAEQVKVLLSQYPADDPAVVSLKQSEVYQKVAYLIEDPKGALLS